MRSGQKPDWLQSTEKEAGARVQLRKSPASRGGVGGGVYRLSQAGGVEGELDFFLRAVGGRQRIR